MNKFWTFIILILVLFFDDNLLNLIGYAHTDEKAVSIFKIHPVAYLSIFILFFFFLKGKLKIKQLKVNCNAELMLIGLCLTLFIYLFLLNRLSSVSFIIDALLTPPVISILFLYTPQRIIEKFRPLLIFTFISNFVLSLIEKVTHRLILRQLPDDSSDFRASGFYGHPLNNALIMSIMGIILYFYFDKPIHKMTVLLMTIVTLLCCGARGGTLGIVGGVVISVIIGVFSKRQKGGFGNLIAVIAALGVGFVILLNTSLGDRLIQKANMSTDDSALERVRTLGLVEKMDDDQLQWGLSEAATGVLMKKGGVTTMENYFVVWITRFGIYVSAVLLLVMVIYASKQIKYFNKSSLIPVLFTLLFVASINNSLSTKTHAFTFLTIFCIFLKKTDKVYMITETF